MHPNDVKLSRLTSNLITLSEEVAAFSVSETKRVSKGIIEARKAAALTSSEDLKGNARKRGRAAVVSWDLGHNPAGRAYVLYQLLKRDWNVDLIGPMWSRYGAQIWAPLKGSDLRVRSFCCSDFTDFIPKAEALASGHHYDIVYVCKPRLPSLYLGALIKEASDCPMVLDVDDFELSFFKDERYADIDELKADVHAALHLPFEELGTRYAQSLVSSADAVTVSNVALRARFGGHIVRHARNEKEFSNSEERRVAARQRLGIAKTDFVLMFIGTPRPHKGVVEVAKALESLGDKDVVFHIVGSISDAALKQQLTGFPNARVVLHPDSAFDELPDLLAGADLVPLIQDVTHPISQYQIPAKVSDALSLGIPVVATSTPPLVDLIASGTIHETDIDGLKDVIARIKVDSMVRRADRQALENSQERRSFLGELGLEVNRTRLDQAISEATINSQREVLNESPVVSLIFSGKDGHTVDNPLPAPLAEMVSLFRSHYKGLRGAQLHSARKRRGEVSPSAKAITFSQKVTQHVPSILRARSASYDIAFFWKQNDSNLYGRRSDMIAKGLAQSGRVRKMIHFDAPISGPSLNENFEKAQVKNGQQELILNNLIDRQMGIFDTEVVRNRTHVFSRQPRPARLLGQEIHSKGSYVKYVNEQLEEHGMRARNTLAWFCPVIWDAPELVEKIGFGGVIADLIDDQRAWDGTPDYKRQLENSYKATLGMADLVFANCESLAETMQSYASKKVHVVPNGAERFDRFPDAPVPEALMDIKGPIVGYVGNLRDRIDWTLLHEVVALMPDVSFVFFGPSSDNPNADSLAKHDNVHVLGVVRYEELAFHLKSLDVGLVPHLNNQLTEKMNPLKVYNYFAAGLPIVSSEVANLESLGSVLRTANTAGEFVQAIHDSLASPVDTTSVQWQATMDVIAWESRVEEILGIMDQSLHRKMRKSA